MRVIVGTRGSKLALLQTEMVVQKLKKLNPELEFEVKIIKTTGDLVKHRPLYSIDGKGLFVKEVDQAVIRGDVDVAVHSLKDVPVYERNSKLLIAAVPKRDDPREALVSFDGSTLSGLPSGAVVGTSSLRKLAQIKYLRRDLEVKPIRGNLDTRIRKVKRGEYQATIVAKAGLDRLGLQSLASEVFPIELFVPAAGQGALAVVTRRDRENVIDVLRRINHPPSMAEVIAERSLIASLKGGCHFPIGVIGRAEGDNLILHGCILSVDGSRKLSASATGRLHEAQRIGEKVAGELLRQGASKVAEEWRRAYGLR